MAATPTPPPFDFDNFAKQLTIVIASALNKGLQNANPSSFSKKVQDSIGDIDVDFFKASIKSLDQMESKLENLRSVRAAGGQEAIDEANQLASLQSEFTERNLKAAVAAALQESITNGQTTADRLAGMADLKKQAESLAAVQAAALMQNIKLDKTRNAIQRDYIQNTDQLIGKLDRVKAIMTDPKLRKTVVATEGINLLIKGIKSLGDEYKKFRDEGQTGTQALDSTFKSLTVSSVLFGTKTGDALKVTQNAVGDLNAVSKDTADKMGMLALITGASAESVGKLQANLQQIPGQTEASAAQTSKFAANLARAANVAPGKVLETMSNSSEEIAKFSADGGQNFARAAVGAQKMGIEVSKIAQAAEGLLNFEDSINKQMEASVLLGREINLDSAREKALQGDLLGASQEMLKNVGGEAEFNKMNLLQKKALADTMGMSVADLGKMVKNQDKFNDAQKEAIANGATMDEVMALGGGFLEKWGGGLKDLGIGLLQAIPTIMVYTSNMQILTATKNAAAVAQGREAVAENAGLLSRLRSTAATIGNTIATTANSLARGAWNIVTGIGSAITNSSIVSFVRESAMKVANTAATIANNVARFFGIGVKGTEAAVNGTLAASNVVLGTTSAAGATGLTTMAAAAAIAVIPLIGLGIAILLMTPALKVIGEVIIGVATVIGNVLMKALEMLPAIIGAVVSGFQVIFGLLAANWKILIPVGFGMMALAAGVAALGVAFAFAFPGLMLGALAMTMMAVPIVAIGAALQYIATSAAGLTMVGAAMQSIGSGLGVMAVNGLAAMPVIGALIGLAAVAPALSKLGDLFGGGGSGGKEDDPLLVEIKGLREDLKKPVPINIDGRKLSDFLRLATNTTAFT